MKRLAIIPFLLASPALAQTQTFTEHAVELSPSTGFVQPPQPSEVDKIREEANGIIAAVRQQRDAANDQLAQAAVQITKLQKELADAKKAAEK